MKTCEVSDVYSLWDAENKNIELVDVRSIEEYHQCHVEGVKHIPLHLLPIRADEVESDKPVYFICLSGARSAQAAQWLAAQRNQEMTNVAGGMHAWLQMGYPVEAA